MPLKTQAKIRIKPADLISGPVCLAALSWPDNIALSCQGQQITYKEFNHQALKLAALIKTRGLKNQKIGILTQKTLSAYIGVLGVLYAGCAYVPLNPKHPLRRLKTIIDKAGISTVIFDESEKINLPQALKALPGIKQVIVPAKDLIGVQPLEVPDSTDPSSLAYIMFTSGSTGEPKGVMVTRANVSSHIQNMIAMYDFSEKDRFSQTFDLSFDPSVSDMFCAWFKGATLCVLSDDEIYCASEYIQREGITFWASVPTLGNFMMKLGKLEAGAFPKLRYSTFCGEPFPQLLANQWSQAAPNSTIENLYGPTEATVYVTRYIYHQPDHQVKYHNNIVPIGAPLPGQAVVIVNAAGQKVTTGEIGELCVSGSQISLGYLNDPVKTTAAFVTMAWDSEPNRRWYRTGDLALVNQNGAIECLGRIDSQIKIGGQRIELGEIEAVLREVTGVVELAVVPAGYENGSPQKLVAFITKRLSQAEIEAIIKVCGTMLQVMFIPKEIRFIQKLPLSVSGKVDRLTLKELAAAGE